jgi:hypothetical protein
MPVFEVLLDPGAAGGLHEGVIAILPMLLPILGYIEAVIINLNIFIVKQPKIRASILYGSM